MPDIKSLPKTRQGVPDLDALCPRRSPGKPAFAAVDKKKLFCTHSYRRTEVGFDPMMGLSVFDDVCVKCGAKRSD